MAWATILLAASAGPSIAQTSDPAPCLPTTDPPCTASPAAVPDPPPPGDLGFRFNGYLRSGFGVDGTGKGQQPFQAPLAGSKYRLGNEAETYLETAFSYGAATEGEHPAYFDTHVLVAYVTPTAQSNSFATTVSLREAYALARGVWASKPQATFWAGARYYDRQDVHITDYYYRDPSGFGGGVEAISLGTQAKLAVAWIGGSQDKLESNGSVPASDQFRLNKNTLDVRFYDLPVGKSRLSLALDLSQLHGDTVVTNGETLFIEDGVGASGTVILESPFRGGRNKLALQYGSGPASDFRSIMTKPPGRTYAPGESVRIDDLWQFRVTNDLLVEQRGPWALQLLTLYQEYENGAAFNSRIRWVSLGARPVRRLGHYASVALEAGWDHTEQSGLPGGSLFKLTLAPQITPAVKFLSRPSLRAYATWAHWSETFRGSVAPVTYPDAVRGVAFGVQMEAWW